MIEQLGLTGISGTITNSVGEKAADEPCSVDNAFTEIMEHILDSIASMHDGSKNIWDIVFQVERKADPKVSGEIIDMSYDETAGLNGVAGLPARFRKKKELPEENDAELADLHEQSEIDQRAVSELAALLKNKERRPVEDIRE